MTSAYQEYLAALKTVAKSRAQTRDARRQPLDREQTAVTAAERACDEARARHSRLAREITRQLASARSALAAIGRCDLPASIAPAAVGQAGADAVTRAVRDVQLAADRLRDAAGMQHPGTPQIAPDRSQRRVIAAAVIGALIMIGALVTLSLLTIV